MYHFIVYITNVAQPSSSSGDPRRHNARDGVHSGQSFSPSKGPHIET